MRLTLPALAALLLTAAPAFAGDDAGTKPGAGKHHGERYQEILKKFDANHDGKLDESERATARAALASKLGEKHPELLKKIDTDGDGVISEAEMKAARAKHHEALKKRVDTDGDGTISDAERAAAKAKCEERKAQHQEHHHDVKPAK